MGLSTLEFNFLTQAFKKGCLPQAGSILEFGECEAIGLNVTAALEFLLPPSPRRDELVKQANDLKGRNDLQRAYEEVKIAYKALFDYSSYAAIDLEPGPAYRIQQDLNQPFDLGKQFDICINNGTSEHLFNQGAFYKAMHDHTRVDGVMIHWTPCLGYHDHGFFNVQPGFFHDLASANDYEMCAANLVTEKMMYNLVPHSINAKVLKDTGMEDALACVVMRKRSDAAFRFPLQRAFQKLERFAS